MVADRGSAPPPVGILALQGDVAEHSAAFAELGVPTRAVRRPEGLVGLAGIVLPGGESTTLSLLLDSSGVAAPLARALHAGLPALGTCAGLVLLATTVLGGRPDQRTFGALDCEVRRNGYGRQRDSFEVLLDATRLSAELGVRDQPMPAVFIRAPVVTRVGAGVEVLATLAGPGGRADPVVLRHDRVLATAFHPELTGDRRVHRLFAAMATGVPVTGRASGAAGPLR